MIVVDASLAAKWILVEADSDRAAALLEEHRRRMLAPDLIAVEVAGSFVRRANSDKSLGQTMRRAMEQWSGLLYSDMLQLRRSSVEQVGRAATLAIDIGHPLKDCLYLVLAIDANCPLVTCDSKFAEKARPRYSDIRLLGDV